MSDNVKRLIEKEALEKGISLHLIYNSSRVTMIFKNEEAYLGFLKDKEMYAINLSNYEKYREDYYRRLKEGYEYYYSQKVRINIPPKMDYQTFKDIMAVRNNNVSPANHCLDKFIYTPEYNVLFKNTKAYRCYASYTT